jgi:hypothetical protein
MNSDLACPSGRIRFGYPGGKSADQTQSKIQNAKPFSLAQDRVSLLRQAQMQRIAQVGW